MTECHEISLIYFRWPNRTERLLVHNLVVTGCYPPEVADHNPSYVTMEVHDLRKNFQHRHTLEGCFVKFALIFSEKNSHSYYVTLDNGKNTFLRIS